MISKNWKDYNLLAYERAWFERLETITLNDLLFLIKHNNPLNHSADFKYSRIEKFIIVLMGMNDSERVEIAIYLIENFWSKLDKYSLLKQLFHHAPFEIFKKYFNKSRLKPDESKFLLLSFLQATDIEEFKWVINHKKTLELLTINNLEFINDNLRWVDGKKLNQEILDLFCSKKEVGIIVVEKGFENLLTQTAKDIFLF